MQKYSTTTDFCRFSLILALLRRKYDQNTAKINENWRFKTHRSADFRFSLPPAQESAPGNDGDVPAKSKEARIRMNTASPPDDGPVA